MKKLVFAGCALLLVPFMTPSFAAQKDTHQVGIEIKNYHFQPEALTIHPGDTVTWTNRDEVPHTVAEKNQQFRSAALDTGDTFSRTFDKPGTYIYFCTLHPTMTGTITVAP
jgi:plastocyanin